MTRKRLPNRRPSITLNRDWRGRNIAITVGIDPATGLVRELFASAPGQTGSDVDHTLADAAVIASLAFQRSASPGELAHSLGELPTWDGQSEPASPVGLIIDAAQEIQQRLREGQA